MKESFAVYGISAASGTKATGHIEVLGRSLSRVGFPVLVANGGHDGPMLLIIAGTHGCEYAGIEAAIRVFKQTDPTRLHGCLVCIPVVNTAAFETQTAYICPIDGADISSVFPGDENGTASQRIAHSLFHDVALKANYVIDLHGGDLPEDLSPYAIFSRSGNKEADIKSKEMARFYGAPLIDEVSRSGMLVHESAVRGIPGIIGESGGLGRSSDEDVTVHVRGVRNIMSYLGMLEDEPQPPPNHQKVFKGEKVRLGVSKGGILRLHVKPGEIVHSGQELGEVRNLQGDAIEIIRSPADAVVRVTLPKYPVNAGDKVVFLSALSDAEPSA